MSDGIPLVFQVSNHPNPFLYIFPDMNHIFQLLGDLHRILGPLIKKGKKFLLFGDKRQFEQCAPPLIVKRRKSEPRGE